MEGIKESAKQIRKKIKSQEHAGALDTDSAYNNDDKVDSQDSLDVLAGEDEDDQQRLQEVMDGVGQEESLLQKLNSQNTTQKGDHSKLIEA